MKSGDILIPFHSCSFTVTFVKVILNSLQFSVTLKAHSYKYLFCIFCTRPQILCMKIDGWMIWIHVVDVLISSSHDSYGCEAWASVLIFGYIYIQILVCTWTSEKVLWVRMFSQPSSLKRLFVSPTFFVPLNRPNMINLLIFPLSGSTIQHYRAVSQVCIYCV